MIHQFIFRVIRPLSRSPFSSDQYHRTIARCTLVIAPLLFHHVKVERYHAELYQFPHAYPPWIGEYNQLLFYDDVGAPDPLQGSALLLIYKCYWMATNPKNKGLYDHYRTDDDPDDGESEDLDGAEDNDSWDDGDDHRLMNNYNMKSIDDMNNRGNTNNTNNPNNPNTNNPNTNSNTNPNIHNKDNTNNDNTNNDNTNNANTNGDGDDDDDDNMTPSQRLISYLKPGLGDRAWIRDVEKFDKLCVVYEKPVRSWMKRYTKEASIMTYSQYYDDRIMAYIIRDIALSIKQDPSSVLHTSEYMLFKGIFDRVEHSHFQQLFEEVDRRPIWEPYDYENDFYS